MISADTIVAGSGMVSFRWSRSVCCGDDTSAKNWFAIKQDDAQVVVKSIESVMPCRHADDGRSVLA